MESDIPAILEKLEPQAQNQYCIAYGPSGSFLFGTPKGYAAANLPPKVIQRLASGSVKRVRYASFGPNVDCWFLVYNTAQGGVTCSLGEGVPSKLRQFAHSVFPAYVRDPAPFLRVQFGPDGAFVAWSKSTWISENIPSTLQRFLKETSYQHDYRTSEGSFRVGYPLHIAFHPTGSFFIVGDEDVPIDSSLIHKYHVWNVETDALRIGWQTFCQSEMASSHHVADLAYFAIDAYSENGDTFIFIKTQTNNKDPDFTLRFASSDLVSRCASKKTSHSGSKELTDVKPVRWARARRTGRPNPRDTWEIYLRKDETVMILEDKGRGWYFVQNKLGFNGYAHTTWLDLDVNRYVKAADAYAVFKKHTMEMFDRGIIRSFPNMADYVNLCRHPHCISTKANKSGLGVCAHDLANLLRGSNAYSNAFLKAERNKWHPDKFARFCHPDNRDELKKKAECMFVLMGVLMADLDQDA